MHLYLVHGLHISFRILYQVLDYIKLISISRKHQRRRAFLYKHQLNQLQTTTTTTTDNQQQPLSLSPFGLLSVCVCVYECIVCVCECMYVCTRKHRYIKLRVFFVCSELGLYVEYVPCSRIPHLLSHLVPST